MKAYKMLGKNSDIKNSSTNNSRIESDEVESPVALGDEMDMENQTRCFDHIIDLLQLHTGHDFSSYKKNTVQRRIERCMGIYQIDSIENYAHFLEENPQELKLLFKEFLIGVTSFFREPGEWELLKDKVIPELLARRSPNDTLRVWISGCSTGEEAYSMAIVIREALDQLESGTEVPIQIFATDLDGEAIDKAREGIFSVNIENDMSQECLNRFFFKVELGYQVVGAIRDMVIFAQQDMIKDPPFTRIDIIICRNLLIYLTPEVQKKLIPLYHYSLNLGGFLFLGSAESVGNFTDLFKPIDIKSRIYQRLQPMVQMEPIEFPAIYASARYTFSQPPAEVQNMQLLVDKLILQYYSPATVLVNGKGDILHITGRTGRYLQPASGCVNWNIFSVVRQGLNYKLYDTFHKALKQKETVTFKSAVVDHEGGPMVVDITVNPIKEPGPLYGMAMVIFTDVTIPNLFETMSTNQGISANNKREQELEQELLQAQQMWQAAGVEMQLSQEELKASNEELQSCNEELQSTNEELTTTKEELQSSNDELKAINYELQSKLDELSLAARDMKNLMNSMKIATLFLDNNLLIRHFTTQMTEVFRLISSDVGRPITDITSDLIYSELIEDAKEVMSTRNLIEKQVKSSKGGWINTRILPCTSAEDKIDGVVITFIDITKFKLLEEEQHKLGLTLDEAQQSHGEAAPTIDRL